MKILILGGDGYLGWPTAMYLSNRGYEVLIVDDYSRKKIANDTNSQALIEGENMYERCEIFHHYYGKRINFKEQDLKDFDQFEIIFKDFMPDTVVHYAEQPSAPLSMMNFDMASYTLNNNLNVTFNLIWSVIKNKKKCHIVKLGTMGEYGTPDIDIEEGWLEINHKNRSDKFLFPRQASSLYHTTKILDTDLLWFYVRSNKLIVTDLMQGPVYGILTSESIKSTKLFPNFHYDSIFGTVINRFLVQAIINHPLTVYGGGTQIRGYLNINDTLKCIELAIKNPPKPGVLDIKNQITETFSVNEIAEIVKNAANEEGLDSTIKKIENPRFEKEKHYYNPTYSSFKKLGLKSSKFDKDFCRNFIRSLLPFKKNIDTTKIIPEIKW
jgi:UDP-sulfoquinovose synthase